ncbi:hypothetical protein [Brevundimonas viscosa]|uniref:Uncharacterized protein n=1 Tax=Brevundimonas viscosa TaxID=871741 RepID=A0A1I6P2I6_9CAUL|nr:hypothetical protein [Brevundimonas viscosa]SFS34411.1 hypothetical protein SAMN05192570_0773 [Brevundimonas viscosa]
MESLFDSIGAILSGLFGLAQGGFDGVNQVMGLLIAVIAALLMTGWRRLWATALGAAVAHVAIGVIRPVLDGGPLELPPLLTLGFWMALLALFLGYAIVIAVFFLIKSLATGGAHRTRHAH